MSRTAVPSVADLVFSAVAPIMAVGAAVKLTQSDGDLAAHTRMGVWILRERTLPERSVASYTAPSEPIIAHAWLSEVLFALMYAAGGLALIAAVTALIIALTHAGIALFLRSRGVDARWTLFASLVSLALGASHWLARPHMFSILAAALTILLLESRSTRRVVLFFPLFLLWANLHGAWLFGLLLIGIFVAGDLTEAWLGSGAGDWKRRAREDALALVTAGIATLFNPYFLGLHREVLGAITSASLAANISEYMSPNFHEPSNLPFLIGLLLCVALLSVTTKRMPVSWLGVLLVSLFFSLRSFRNVALFGVTAWPLLALHVSGAWPRHRRRFPWFGDFARIEWKARPGFWSLPAAVAVLALGLNGGTAFGVPLISAGFDSKVMPVHAVDRARQANLPGRIFHPWVWGGYLMHSWPGKPIHVDPLKFSAETMKSYERIDALRPGWQAELRRWNVGLAIIKADASLAAELAKQPGWTLWYRDSTAVVFRATGIAATPAKRGATSTVVGQ